MEIADLGLLNFREAENSLTQALDSSDPWERYWAILVCSTFGERAIGMEATIKEISTIDSELINKVRAAEFLGIVKKLDPSLVMTNALYASEKPSEALLILNSIVLMTSSNYNYNFNIERDKMSKVVTEDPEVMRRLEFLIVQ